MPDMPLGCPVPLTYEQLAYLSRAIFRQRIDKPEDSPALVARLDPHISVWRDRAYAAERIAERQSEGGAA